MSERMTHIWVSRKWLADRRGQRCRLLKVSRGKFVIQFADGWITLTVRGTFRVSPEERQRRVSEGLRLAWKRRKA